jgi:gas vesicle protein
MKKALNFLLGAIIGGIIGGAAAVLFAPFSGEELRNQLRSRVDNIQIEIQDAAKKKRVDLETRLDELKTS